MVAKVGIVAAVEFIVDESVEGVMVVGAPVVDTDMVEVDVVAMSPDSF